jgi:hypothetical protein
MPFLGAEPGSVSSTRIFFGRNRNTPIFGNGLAKIVGPLTAADPCEVLSDHEVDPRPLDQFFEPNELLPIEVLTTPSAGNHDPFDTTITVNNASKAPRVR